jgi:hypothetical protein
MPTYYLMMDDSATAPHQIGQASADLQEVQRWLEEWQEDEPKWRFWIEDEHGNIVK